MNVQSGIGIGMVVSVEHAAYNDLVTEPLGRLRDTWGNPDSVMSILLACTYSVLSNAAVATNYSIKLGEERKVKFRHHPKVKQAEKFLLAYNKNFTELSSSSCATPAALLSAREVLIQAGQVTDMQSDRSKSLRREKGIFT